MQGLRDALWQADEAAGWHDNVTIALAQVISGGAIADTEQSAPQPLSNSKATLIREKRKWKIFAGCLLAVLLIVIGCMLYPKFNLHDSDFVTTDSIEVLPPMDSTLVNDTTHVGE